MSAIEIRFKHTEKEYLSAQRRYMLSRKGTIFYLILTSSLVLIGAFLLVMGADPTLMISFLGTGLVLSFLLLNSFTILPARRFRADPRFKHEYCLRFVDDGIEFNTLLIESKISWELYKEAWETDKFYLLSDGASILTVIPKRAFASTEQESVFKDLLNSKV